MRRFYYFGCRRREVGHYLHTDGGERSTGVDESGLDGRFPGWLLDGTFAPIDPSDRAWRLTLLRGANGHVISILACHDNTIDARPGSNAAFVVVDAQPWDAEHILAEMRGRFPDCWERLRMAAVST